MPGFPATDLITAVGVASGLAVMGIGQAAKQLKKSYRPPKRYWRRGLPLYASV